MSAGVSVKTFGCRLNIWESEVMRGLAEQGGIEQAIIVNSCAVTEEAERQTRQFIRRTSREQPGVPIIVTGCAAELNPARYATLPGVLRVVRNDEKLKAASWGGNGADDKAPVLRDGFAGNTRGFLQVQQGCDHRCTFCIIPYARGPCRSVEISGVIENAERLLQAGHREIVLTGVDIVSWGLDLGTGLRLGDLVRDLLAALPALERLRLSSLDPAAIDETLWDIFGREDRLMPHFHLSAQAGDDLVLKQMKRRHLRRDVLAVAARARRLRPEVAIGADLIAGFPTESEQQFERTVSLVAEAELDYLHVFPYSPREGTPAARLKPLPPPVVSARAAALRAAGDTQRRRRFASLQGRTLPVLMERNGVGHTPCFAPVRPASPLAAGEIVPLRLREMAGDHLIGDVS